MNKNPLLSILLLSVSLAGARPASAQSVTGSWVKTSEILTHADGKSANSFEKITKAMPCIANIVYTFYPGGRLKEDASGCPGPVQKAEAFQVTWKQKDEKITLDIDGCCAPMRHSVFHVRFEGENEMVWTFVYAENPGTPNPTKAKEMKTTYHRRS